MRKSIRVSASFAAPFAIIAAAVALFFYPCLKAAFVNWDDLQLLGAIPANARFSVANISLVFSSFNIGHYHPLTMLSFLADRTLFGINPFAEHIVNLILHCANSCLAYLLVLWFLKDRTKALISALIFALHPMHVESVAWVAERKDLLYSFFYLLAMLVYRKHAEKGNAVSYTAALLLFCLAILSKSMAITLPGLLLLMDWKAAGKITKYDFLEKIPFLFFSVLGARLAVITQGGDHFVTAMSASKIFSGIMLVCGNFVFYLIKFFLPTGLCAFYPYQGVPATYYFAPPLIALVICFAWRQTRKGYYMPAFGLLFFGITLSPVLQFIPAGYGIAADHFTYIPFLGIIIPLADWLVDFSNRQIPDKKRLATAFCVVWLLVLGCAATARCRVWQDSITLWNSVLKRYPDCYIALVNRTSAFMDAGRYDDALRDAEQALSLMPNHRHRPLMMAANACYAKKDYARAEKLINESLAAGLKQNDYWQLVPQSLYVRALILAAEGKADAAMASNELALTADPGYPDALIERIRLRLSMGDNDGAMSAAQAATMQPGSAALAHEILGSIYSGRGEYDKAADNFLTALEQKPHDPKLYEDLAIVYLNTGQMEKARFYMDNCRANGGNPPVRLISLIY